MAVRIRLSRIGKKHRPYHRIVAIDSRAKRDGKFLEKLGTFDPIKKQFVTFDLENINKWKKLGATCSDAVAKLITMYNKTNAQQESA